MLIGISFHKQTFGEPEELEFDILGTIVKLANNRH